MQIPVVAEQRSKLRTLSVLECPHATEFRVFDYSECQEICSVCGKVIGTIQLLASGSFFVALGIGRKLRQPLKLRFRFLQSHIDGTFQEMLSEDELAKLIRVIDRRTSSAFVFSS